ncbi:hypothetical protein IMCC3088_933 [Aequoribacter fuscus]|uniref:Uncharacterized protein n=1 Tax=Aequoribacter fuscus TaxID=2518989 RepID=F3L0J7_9GAMM|nr:hypothetical protein IMCC3088_933 [Aequoribacter fuscus]
MVLAQRLQTFQATAAKRSTSQAEHKSEKQRARTYEHE